MKIISINCTNYTAQKKYQNKTTQDYIDNITKEMPTEIANCRYTSFKASNVLDEVVTYLRLHPGASIEKTLPYCGATNARMQLAVQLLLRHNRKLSPKTQNVLSELKNTKMREILTVIMNRRNRDCTYIFPSNWLDGCTPEDLDNIYPKIIKELSL